MSVPSLTAHDDAKRDRNDLMREEPRLQPAHPHLGSIGFRLAHPILRTWAAGKWFLTADSGFARDRSRSLREKLDRGAPTYFVGLGSGGHDSGAALVEVTARDGTRLISSHEEERFTGVKHESSPPLEALALIRSDLERLGLFQKDVDGFVASFDYVQMFARGVESCLEELPSGLGLVHPDVYPAGGLGPQWRAFDMPRLLAEALPGCDPRIIGMGHHENHASFAWALSPFAQCGEPVLVLVLDATGDDCAISAYLAKERRLAPLYRNHSLWDSLGHFYGLLSSTFGGWPIGSAEGRWMAAAGFGNQDPAVNPYYEGVSRLIRRCERGEIRIDRTLANWHNAGARRPFSSKFLRALGVAPEVARAGLNELCFGGRAIPEVAHLAAATQLVFEEVLLHLVEHWVGVTGVRRLVLTGGTALNCVAIRKLVLRFKGALDVWVPPAPADEATAAGAAFHFALRNGAQPGDPLAHAFYCGQEPQAAEIERALRSATHVEIEPLGDASDLARLLAIGIADEGVVGLFRGRAEIGRRALGHRSILASPRRAATRDHLNRNVKEREVFRPFAPLCTLRDARRWFDFDQAPESEAGSVYRWMALAVRAKPEAFEQIPAALHVDGTARIQIVSHEDTLLVSFLEELGRLTGAEVALNTSLNLHAPIVQTPAQAARLLRVSRGLEAILFVASSGDAYLAWSTDVRERTGRIRSWLARWRDRNENVVQLRGLERSRG
jgi:carbamoyltransferase